MKKCRNLRGKDWIYCPHLRYIGKRKIGYCNYDFTIIQEFDVYLNRMTKYRSEDCKLTLTQTTFDNKPESETFIPEEV